MHFLYPEPIYGGEGFLCSKRHTGAVSYALCEHVFKVTEKQRSPKDLIKSGMILIYRFSGALVFYADIFSSQKEHYIILECIYLTIIMLL